MSSNPLYGLRKVGSFVQLTGLPGRPVRQPVFAGCTWRLCDRRLWLVTKSALEVYVVHDDALCNLTTFTFTFTICDLILEASWHRLGRSGNCCPRFLAYRKIFFHLKICLQKSRKFVIGIPILGNFGKHWNLEHP